MSIEIYFIAVVILLLFAVFDLSVGVANDAVNFLNSSIGSRVAPYFVIMITASLGILAVLNIRPAIFADEEAFPHGSHAEGRLAYGCRGIV